MKRFKTALALGLLAVLILSVAGCTSSNTANTTNSGSLLFFADFEHRNRKLFRIVRAHHLLQHVNDLTNDVL